MSVELDPPELGFRRPFTHEVSQVLRLRNPTGDPIAFKVSARETFLLAVWCGCDCLLSRIAADMVPTGQDNCSETVRRCKKVETRFC
jgi:hypothetical protein